MPREGHELLPVELLNENNGAIERAIAQAIAANEESHTEPLELYDTRGIRMAYKLSAEGSIYTEKEDSGKVKQSINMSVIIRDGVNHIFVGERHIQTDLSTDADKLITFTSGLLISVGFEGLGIGTALFQATEDMIQWAIGRFPNHFRNKTIKIIIQDTAKSTNPKLDRNGWTSRRTDGKYRRLSAFSASKFVKYIQ